MAVLHYINAQIRLFTRAVQSGPSLLGNIYIESASGPRRRLVWVLSPLCCTRALFFFCFFLFCSLSMIHYNPIAQKEAFSA